MFIIRCADCFQLLCKCPPIPPTKEPTMLRPLCTCPTCSAEHKRSLLRPLPNPRPTPPSISHFEGRPLVFISVSSGAADLYDSLTGTGMPVVVIVDFDHDERPSDTNFVLLERFCPCLLSEVVNAYNLVKDEYGLYVPAIDPD